MAKEIKEITVFCEQGDSAKISTWSNVPYFLTETLIAKGITVNRVNLHPGTSKLHKIFYKLWNVFAKGVFRNKYYTYRRTGIYFYLMDRRIKKAVKKYPDSDAFLFTTYNLTARKYTDKTVILFSDWTADYDARCFKGVDPTTLPYHERLFIARQKRNIETADCVVSLFPGMASDMQRVYPTANIHYIGNVVNSLYEPDRQIINEKENNHDILFVGKKHYLKGALELLEAFKDVKAKLPDARLHIIGMKPNKFDNLPDGAECYGYLSKDATESRKKYYELLSRCRLFINTTPKWGAFSASVEAMYHYTPVIITPYCEFVNTFGNDIDFGYYHNPEKGVNELSELMIKSLTDTNFAKQAEHAHKAVEEMTWNNFTDKLIELIK